MQTLKSKSLFVFLTALLLLPNLVSAAGSRLNCGNERIRDGDTMHEVKRDCGAPTSEMQVGEKTIKRGIENGRLVEETRYITEWIYDFGSAVYTLTFEGMCLTKTKYSRH